VRGANGIGFASIKCQPIPLGGSRIVQCTPHIPF
jgi:hypothetical protein